jgi:chitinase
LLTLRLSAPKSKICFSTSESIPTKGGDSFDAVDALSIPITMIADAVDNMASIAAIGQEIEGAEAKAKRNAIIFGFISAILFFVPVAGEVLSAVSSLATIGRIVALLGNLGNVAFEVYTIVDDPEMRLWLSLG